MADNVDITAGSGTTIATDDCAGKHVQLVKLVDGTADSTTVIPGDSNGLKVQLGVALPAGTATIGKLAANSGVDIGDVDVTSVPAPLNLTGGGVELSALRVTIANDSTGVLSVDDNSGSLTVDNNGTFAVQATLAAETTKVIGTVNISASQSVGVSSIAAGTNNIGDVDVASIAAGDNNIGNVDIVTVPTDPFGTNADAASATGSISAKLRYLAGTGLAGMTALPAGSSNIGDVDVLTVPAPLSSTGGGTEAAALRVTVANDSTGVLSIDDNGGSLTVDNGGTFAVQATLAAETTKVIGTVNIAASQTVGLAAGSQSIGILGANSGVDVGDVTINNASGASAVNIQDGGNSITVDGAVTATNIPAGTTGGASTMNASSSDGATALTNSAQAIKASAGSLVGYYIYNPNTAAVFVCFYNVAAASVTVGTTNPLFMLTIPATSAANLWMTGGIAFGTAISWAAASTAGGNGAPTTALDAIAWYI